MTIPNPKDPISRRRFLKRCVIGGCAAAWGIYAGRDLLQKRGDPGFRAGFHHDAPPELWKWSREADFYDVRGSKVFCQLCPHECVLEEDDRGFCRTRVVKKGRLHTVAYGNPCSVHVDPMEKKPLCHFLPGTPILSLATAGCNLRCINCQNWEISQAKPEETRNFDLMPGPLVEVAAQRKIPSIAYTYSDPVIYYEYTYDASVAARARGIRNVLVTAGYIAEKPLRKLCRVTDAAKLDLKAFNENFYKKVTGAKLAPVLRCLEVMLEEGVWVEVTRLVVPTLSDDMDDLAAMCRWMYTRFGPSLPLHLSRFYPAYKLTGLPPTPVETMNAAYQTALDAGLRYVYVGNVPGHAAQHTICPACGLKVIERSGYTITANHLAKGRCVCGESIPGVWS